MSDQEKVAALRQKYLALAHGMQTGVEFTKDKNDQTPKHLRVGINTVMSDHSALVHLLIAKGVITELEYYEALVTSMQHEVDSYQRRICGEYDLPSDKVTLS